MAYTKTNWVDRAVATPNLYTKSGETATEVTLVQKPGVITNAGTPLNASNMNKIESELEELSNDRDSIQSVQANLVAIAEINSQSIGQSGYGYDLMRGEDNTYSAAQIDVTRVNAQGALSAGATSLTFSNGTLVGSFSPGQEVTIQDIVTETKRQRVTVVSANSISMTFTPALTTSFAASAVVYRSLVEIDRTNQRMLFSPATEFNPGASMEEQPDLPSTPSEHVYGISWAPNGRFVVVCTLNENFDIFKYENGVFTKVPDPSNWPVGFNGDVTWTPDSQYFALATDNSPYVWIYKKQSGDTYEKISNPSSLPAHAAEGIDYSPDGVYLVVSNYNLSPYIKIYKRSGDTHTALADPATMPSGACYAVQFSPDGVHLVVSGSGSEIAHIYKRSGDTFTKLTSPWVGALPSTGLRRHGIDFTADGVYMACGINFTWYKRSGDTFTKLANPTSMPGTVMSLRWTPDGRFLVCASTTSPYIFVYQRTGDTLTLVAGTPTLPSGSNAVGISPNGEYIMFGHATSPYVNIYRTGEGIDVNQVDVRYNITPPEGLMDELRAWVRYEEATGFTVSSALSIVDSAANESYVTMTPDVADLEDQKEVYLEGSVGTAQEKGTQRITMNRAATTDDVAITKYLAAIIAP